MSDSRDWSDLLGTLFASIAFVLPTRLLGVCFRNITGSPFALLYLPLGVYAY